MNPWDILGWLVVAFVAAVPAIFAFVVVLALLSWARARLRTQWLHWRTRRLAPQPGDIWCPAAGGEMLHIKALRDGSITIQTGAAHWWETGERWKARVREWKLYRARSGASR